MDGGINEGGGLDLTIKPGNGDTLKENQEQQAHATGRVIIKEFEDINATLKETKGQSADTAPFLHTLPQLQDPEEAGLFVAAATKLEGSEGALSVSGAHSLGAGKMSGWWQEMSCFHYGFQ